MKNNIVRIILFFVVVFSGFSGPVEIFVMSIVLYSFLYFGIEVIIVAGLIDAYFGYPTTGWLVYTFFTTAVLLLAQFLKPHLSIYHKE